LRDLRNFDIQNEVCNLSGSRGAVSTAKSTVKFKDIDEKGHTR